MRIVTATRLRSTLYKTLQDLSSGGKVRIRSKWGAFIVQNETDSQASRPKKKALEPLLNGTINEDFDNADLVLRKHIRVSRFGIYGGNLSIQENLTSFTEAYGGHRV